MELPKEKIYKHWRQRFAWVVHFLKAYFKHKERPRVRRLSSFIPQDGVVFDIGAHFGYLAKEFAALHAGRCHVYCFEPVSYTYSILEKVMHRYPNKTLETLALSDSNGMLSITIPVKPSGRLGIGLSHFGPEQTWDFITENIRTEKLDDYVKRAQIKRLDFIKIDVEGAELLVLRGASNTLMNLRPAVYCEIQPHWTQRMGYTPADLFGYMIQHGYSAFVFSGDAATEAPHYMPEHEDYLFLPRKD